MTKREAEAGEGATDDGRHRTDDDTPDDRRRRLLAYVSAAALGGAASIGSWYAVRSGDRSPSPRVDATTGEAPPVVERYAPDLYFGRLEKWYPTDPRPYVLERDGESVVDGFTALDEYSAAYAETGEPPAPTLFFHVTEAADGVDAIQYWMYSVFDQFTANFHWHDWELLQVFVDRETDEPLLLSASAHSRSVPNNEFFEPALPGDRRPGILSEVGSHSSASEINDVVPSFERVDSDGWHPDVTNGVVDGLSWVTAPFAYGLPRDEGARLPFAMPELDGDRLDRHPALSVTREDFVDESVTVDSWHGLPDPPTDLPLREPGLVMAHPDSTVRADATYALEPIGAVSEAIDDFAGPQLSFEFAIPGFVEDRIAGHITSVGIPWEQGRFADPLDDVTDPAHLERLSGRTPDGLRNRVVGRVRQLRSGADGALDGVTEEAREALTEAITVSRFGLPVEVVARLASADPVVSVTRSGVFGFLQVDPGEHHLVVNGPGYAPVAEGFDHEGGLVLAGAEGELTVVATEDAGWIRGDGRDATGIDRVRVIENYAGVVYDGRPVEDDRFAVAVHRAGRYTVEVEDSDGRPGAFRVVPGDFDDDSEAVRDVVETGKAPLARTLRDVLAELLDLARSLAERDGAESELAGRVAAALEEADGVASAAGDGDARTANERLARVASSLEEALAILLGDRRGGYSDASAAALDPRIREAIRRVELALETELS